MTGVFYLKHSFFFSFSAFSCQASSCPCVPSLTSSALHSLLLGKLFKEQSFLCLLCCTAYEAREKDETLTARRVGEVVSSTLGVLATALDYPKSECLIIFLYFLFIFVC